MSTKTTCIADHDSPSAPVAGARRVQWFLKTAWGGAWVHKGWLMPQYKDTRQQPKSLAFKLVEARN